MQSIGGLRISSNDQLSDLSLPGLLEVWGDVGVIRVTSNPSLPALDLPALQFLADNLVIAANGSLAALSLPWLESVGGALYIVGNGVLPTSVAEALRDALTDIGDGWTIEDNGPG